MGAMEAAALMQFAHLICPHTVMHVIPSSQNLPCPYEEKQLPTLHLHVHDVCITGITCTRKNTLANLCIDIDELQRLWSYLSGMM